MYISLEDVNKNHDISEVNIIHDAIKELINIYELHRGEWKIVTDELEYYPGHSPMWEASIVMHARQKPGRGGTSLPVDAMSNYPAQRQKTWSVKKEDLNDYLKTIHDLEKEQAKDKGPILTELRKMKLLAGALMVAHYQDTKRKTGNKNLMPSTIENKLEATLSLLDYDLGLINKKLRSKIIPGAIDAFLELQKQKK